MGDTPEAWAEKGVALSVDSVVLALDSACRSAVAEPGVKGCGVAWAASSGWIEEDGTGRS